MMYLAKVLALLILTPLLVLSAIGSAKTLAREEEISEGWKVEQIREGLKTYLQLTFRNGQVFTYVPEDWSSSLLEMQAFKRRASQPTLLVTRWLRGRSEAIVVFEPVRAKGGGTWLRHEDISDGEASFSWNEASQHLVMTIIELSETDRPRALKKPLVRTINWP